MAFYEKHINADQFLKHKSLMVQFDAISYFDFSSYHENKNENARTEPEERPRTKPSSGKPPKSSPSAYGVRLIKQGVFFSLADFVLY